MGVLPRRYKALLVLFALSGCAEPGKSVLKTFFFCGCDECAAFMKSAPPSLLEHGKVIFRGGPGDAEEFRKRFRIASKVVSDFDGKLFETSRIKTCPAVIVANDRERVVLGNGAKLDPPAIRRAEERMSR